LGVRPYNPADRAAVHRIAADTAFFGQSVEKTMDDRNLFCDAFYAYYTDVEPEHGWIATAGQEVVGFLMGCVETAGRGRRWLRHVLPRLVRRTLRGQYHIGKRTRTYLAALARAVLRGELPHVDLERYPAHLHINVDAAWRGRGLGRSLMEAYLGQLRQLRVPGVHLETTSMNQVACQLYEKVGFELLEARPTRIWAHLVDQAVELRCYGMRL
jgi:ribosomal protein S18 acetylase RimI-like enzyme